MCLSKMRITFDVSIANVSIPNVSLHYTTTPLPSPCFSLQAMLSPAHLMPHILQIQPHATSCRHCSCQSHNHHSSLHSSTHRRHPPIWVHTSCMNKRRHPPIHLRLNGCVPLCFNFVAFHSATHQTMHGYPWHPNPVHHIFHTPNPTHSFLLWRDTHIQYTLYHMSGYISVAQPRAGSRN